MQPWFTVHFFDIGHPCYDQLTLVKTRYPLTSITWPYRGLRVTTRRGLVFYLKLTADQVLFLIESIVMDEMSLRFETVRELVVCKWTRHFIFSCKGNLILLFFTRSKINERSRIVVSSGSENSGKLTFSRFTEVLTVAMATSVESMCWRDFAEGNHSTLALDCCSLRVLV